MTDHLTDDDLRKAHEFARRYANDEYVSDRDRAAARVILAHAPHPGPAPLTEWSDDLAGTWVEYEGDPAELLGPGGEKLAYVRVHSEYTYITTAALSTLTPRSDLAPVEITPRPIGPEATPRTVATVEEYAALPEGSVVAQPEDGVLLLMGGRWHDPLGRGPYTHDLMRGITSVLLREGWGE